MCADPNVEPASSGMGSCSGIHLVRQLRTDSGRRGDRRRNDAVDVGHRRSFHQHARRSRQLELGHRPAARVEVGDVHRHVRCGVLQDERRVASTPETLCEPCHSAPSKKTASPSARSSDDDVTSRRRARCAHRRRSSSLDLGRRPAPSRCRTSRAATPNRCECGTTSSAESRLVCSSPDPHRQRLAPGAPADSRSECSSWSVVGDRVTIRAPQRMTSSPRYAIDRLDDPGVHRELVERARAGRVPLVPLHRRRSVRDRAHELPALVRDSTR